MKTGCLQWKEGDVLVVDKTTVVKARSITYGAEVVYSDVATATYDIAGGTAVVDDSTNGLAIAAWLEYEAATRQVFSDKYFGGCEPIVGCGGGLDLGQLGKYYICDVDSNITDPAACESAGGGWISWDVVQEGLGGGSTFFYSNYKYTLASGQELTATGSVVGHFDSGGSGTTNTSEGETVQIAGAFNASIDDSVVVTDRQKTGGSYYVVCADEGCAATGLTYLVSPGPVVELLPPSDASCDLGPAFIRIQQDGDCLSPSNKGPFADLLSCNAELTDQQWELVENLESTDEQEDFIIQLKDGSGCLSAKPVDGGPFLYYEVASCIGNDPTQVFTFEKSPGEEGKLARIVASPNAFAGHPEKLCLAPLAPSAKLISAYDCSDATKSFDYEFAIGNTFPVETLDPTTDLLEPLQPVTFVLSGRSDVNHQSSVVIASPLHDNLTMTATAQNNSGSAKKVSASNLEGFGVYTSGANLNGIQTNEQLVINFDQPVDISNITLRQWEGPDQVKIRWNGDNFVITDDSDGFNSEESVDVDMKGVTWIAIKGDSIWTVTYLKSLTVTPTIR